MTTFPRDVPVLTGGRVRLRAMTEADLPFLVGQGADPDTQRWTPLPRPYGPAQAREFLTLQRAWWERDESRVWVIDLAGEPASYAGTVEVRPAGKPHGPWDVGFALHRGARGRGAASAALRLVAAWSFDQGAPRLYWTCARGNFASWRVAWACGFTHHGTRPGALPGYDGPQDAWSASLAPGEPMRPRTPWFVAPVIAGEQVRLRPWRDDDADAIEEPDHAAHHLPAAIVPTPGTFAEWLLRRRERMALGAVCAWCIADAATDRALGEVGLFARGGEIADLAELGYQLLPSARGRGVMRQAAALALAHGLRPEAAGGLGLRRLRAETSADNAASIAVLRRLGFTPIGVEHAVDPLPGGGHADAIHWELLAGT